MLIRRIRRFRCVGLRKQSKSEKAGCAVRDASCYRGIRRGMAYSLSATEILPKIECAFVSSALRNGGAVPARPEQRPDLVASGKKIANPMHQVSITAPFHMKVRMSPAGSHRDSGS